jgi:hypothetical protein
MFAIVSYVARYVNQRDENDSLLLEIMMFLSGCAAVGLMYHGIFGSS